MGSITSANAVIMLTVKSVYDVPQQLQGFTADDIFDVEDIPVSENVMGVDGILSSGFVNAATAQTIALQADSISNAIFDGWYRANKLQQDGYRAQATVTLTSIGAKFTCTNGYLERWRAMPSAGRVLQPRRARVIWESVVRSKV